MKIFKSREVKDSQRNVENAGVDFFVPNYTPQFAADLLSCNVAKPILIREIPNVIGDGREAHIDGTIKQILVPPNVGIKIPLGIHSLFERNEALLMSNKSGVCTKKQFIVGADLIDFSYEGEIHAHIINVSNDTAIIEFGEKIVQGIIIKINDEPVEIVSTGTKEDFYANHTKTRRDGGFGSTGTK